MLGLVVNYTLPTSSNEPTILVNSHFIATSLIKPNIGDFATFHPPIPGDVNQVYVKRLCGLEGDEIEMKNGLFYRNRESFDSNLVLQHGFVVEESIYKRINGKYPIGDVIKGEATLYEIMITDAVALEFNIQDFKSIHKTANLGPPVFVDFDEGNTWTRDNFGSLKIPAGMSFFMGDNRHYSYDCRYFGFVPMKDISGTVLGK